MVVPNIYRDSGCFYNENGVTDGAVDVTVTSPYTMICPNYSFSCRSIEVRPRRGRKTMPQSIYKPMIKEQTRLIAEALPAARRILDYELLKKIIGGSWW